MNTVDLIQKFWDARCIAGDDISRLENEANAVMRGINTFEYIADCAEILRSARGGYRKHLILECQSTQVAMKNQDPIVLWDEYQRTKKKIAALQRKLDALPPRIEALNDEKRLTHNSIVDHYYEQRSHTSDDFVLAQEQRIRDIQAELRAAIESMDDAHLFDLPPN